MAREHQKHPPWEGWEDKRLIAMLDAGNSIRAIGIQLDRSWKNVSDRIKLLRLDETFGKSEW